MTQTTRLLAHDSPDSILAYRGGFAITAGQFLADVARAAALLPAGRNVLNLCADRYLFAVGFAACILREKRSLLPPTYVPEVIRQLQALAPDAFCLTDDPAAAIELPIVTLPTDLARPLPAWRVPAIPRDLEVASVFTSGSTGVPVAHPKSWGRLAANVTVEASRMGLHDGRRQVLVATVPAQHMYGFESSVLVALQSGQAFCAERPFYPADIAAVLGAVPGPRILVSTPIHLRALLASAVALPPLGLVLCATAPLAADLAREVEARFDCALLEIYGSTETGQIASRHPTQSPEWQLWPGVALDPCEAGTVARGGHLEAPVTLGDVVEPTGADRFLLRGRTADLVNIAGKRSSLGHLTHQLLSIPGVEDGAFYLPEESAGAPSRTGAVRLAAVAVAPGVEAETILRALRERIDAVFLPRPLRLVDALPRNSTGKLPRALLASAAGSVPPPRPAVASTLRELVIPADHPAFPGHFPGRPVVPGVVLLDAALHAVASAAGAEGRPCTLSSVKFHRPLQPGEPATLRFESRDGGRFGFEVESAGQRVASGTLAFDGRMDESRGDR